VARQITLFAMFYSIRMGLAPAMRYIARWTKKRQGRQRNKSPTISKEGISMGILSWIILGLIAGALAKWLMPGDDGGGWFMTMVLGIAGAFAGGFIGSFVGLGTTGGFSIGSIITATVGAFILLFLYNKLIK